MFTIEKAKFDEFIRNFKAGEYGNQRLGQAFYNEFRLDKSSIDSHNLWIKDGDSAMRSILSMVEFS